MMLPIVTGELKHENLYRVGTTLTQGNWGWRGIGLLTASVISNGVSRIRKLSDSQLDVE